MLITKDQTHFKVFNSLNIYMFISYKIQVREYEEKIEITKVSAWVFRSPFYAIIYILSIIYIIITQVTDIQLSCQEYYNRISLMIKNYI